MTSVKKYNEMSCYLQCNSAKPAVRQNHSTPQQISVSRTEANLVFMNVKYAAVKATPCPTNQRRCLYFKIKVSKILGNICNAKMLDLCRDPGHYFKI